ncbi:unnamed protein product [Paramecium octaurelia]|uniref:Uncharacterized protein n=1 Tax=Paramecium octaurelia TaxID=43137 RepID=A0A8S1UWW2_PAROT|nr:unnamed protein product [Paramecium octaurelia]
MGNTNICCVEQNDEPFDKRKFLFHKKLNSLNNQLMTTIQYQDIIIFHKWHNQSSIAMLQDCYQSLKKIQKQNQSSTLELNKKQNLINQISLIYQSPITFYISVKFMLMKK